MNKNSKRLGLYVLLMTTFIISSVTLRTIACMTDLDYESGYFDNGTLMLVSGIVAAVGVVAMLSLAGTLKPVSLKASFSTPSTFVPTGAVAISLVSLSIALLTSSNFISFSPTRVMDTPYEVLCLISAIFALLSVAHFFFNAFLTDRHTQLRAYFALGTIVFLALFASMLYFDTSRALNSPTKLVDQMAMLFAAIFFLYEARISLGREMWRAYSGFGLAAALLLAYAAIPEVIVYLVRGKTIALHIEGSVLTLALFIFVFSRLCLTMTLHEEGESREVSILREFAQAREAELRDEEHLRGKDDIQLTIDDLFGEQISTIPVDIEGADITEVDADATTSEVDDSEERTE